MNLYELRLFLFALTDGATLAAVVALAFASTALAVITRRLLREPLLAMYCIAVPAGSAPAAELLFAHLHALVGHRGRGLSWLPDPIVLAVDASPEGLRLRIALSERDARRLSSTLGSIWPGAQLVARSVASTLSCAALEWRPDVEHVPHPRSVPGAELTLPRALARAAGEDQLSYELVLRPAPSRPRPRIWDLHRSGGDRWPSGADGRPVGAGRHLLFDTFECRLRVRAGARTTSRAESLVRELEPVVHVLCSGSSIRLCAPRRSGRSYRLGLGASNGRLAPAELAILFPLIPVAAAVAATTIKHASEGERLLGLREVGSGERDVRLSLSASRQHLHVLGPTGTGKSTLLLNLIAQDIAAGRGCAVLDPKGDLVRDLLLRIPRRRVADVVYVGPDESSRAVGINPLQLGPHEDPTIAAENVLSIFKRVYADSWGPRTDDVLKSCLLTLVAVPGATLAHIPALLSDGAVRRKLTTHVDDVGVGSFWRWYERVSEGKRLEVAAPLQHKLRDVLVRPRLRRLLCQTHSSVELGTLMDRGGILLADLGTGRWGEGASALAGSFLVARLWQAALSRQARTEQERMDFLLYVDEFQTFLGIGGPFADALAQARALRLSLTLANQHLGQLPREISAAVAANARSRIVFRPSAPDASALASEFAPLDEHALLTLAPFEAAIRLRDSEGAFTARMLPPAVIPFDAAPPEEVLRHSAARYGRPVADVDDELRRAAGPLDRGDEPVQTPSPS